MTTLNVSLSPAAEATLRERAAATGQPLDAYATAVLERAAVLQSADEMMAPVRRRVAESGISDDDLDAFIDDVRNEAFRDRQGKA